MCLYVNIDMKYLGLELSLGVGLCGRDVVFFICGWPWEGCWFFSFVAGLVLGEKGNDLILVLEG